MSWSWVKQLMILFFVFILILVFFGLRFQEVRDASYAIRKTLVTPHVIDISRTQYMNKSYSPLKEIVVKQQKIPKIINSD